jgi:hypothetical protein
MGVVLVVVGIFIRFVQTKDYDEVKYYGDVSKAFMKFPNEGE